MQSHAAHRRFYHMGESRRTGSSGVHRPQPLHEPARHRIPSQPAAAIGTPAKALALRAAVLGSRRWAWPRSRRPSPAPRRHRPAASSTTLAPALLDQVLGHFGRRAGVLVAIDPELTKGLRSEGLTAPIP
ncbi:hypothetical protein ACU4GD_10755 [Cupriavidus basilensis]